MKFLNNLKTRIKAGVYPVPRYGAGTKEGIASICIAVFSAATQYAYAQNNITITNLQGIGTQILCPVAAVMFYVLILISTIMVLYAAFVYVTAGGDSEKVGRATKTITYAAVAIVVAVLAKSFPVIIASILGQSTQGCP
ncbi:MAG TPA: hypothetical protein VNG29_02840 [Candidatus Paceibacterota bacterium]|nr:hypothetical protein [Candidatus Paceibacterota bacterium]